MRMGLRLVADETCRVERRQEGRLENCPSTRMNDQRMPLPLITVIVPTRDRPEMLRAALESLRKQRLTDWECVVVDDGGAVPAVVPDDPRFRLIRSERSRGPAGARNIAIRSAVGTYVSLLDDDDEYPPEALMNLMSAAVPDTIVFGQYAFIGSGAAERSTDWSGRPGGNILRDPPRQMCGLYPRTSILEYDEDFRTGEDIEWLFRMAESHIVRTIPHVTYLYRRNPQERPGVEEGTHLQGRLHLLQKHESWFAAHPSLHAHQLGRCAAAAYLDGDHSRGLRLALESLRRRPSPLAVKLLLRCSVGRVGQLLGPSTR